MILLSFESIFRMEFTYWLYFRDIRETTIAEIVSWSLYIAWDFQFTSVQADFMSNLIKYILVVDKICLFEKYMST